MKYINHMTTSIEDQKHEALIEKCGLAGYGAYWVIVEKIGAAIRPESVSTSLTLTWRNWARHLRVDDVRTAKHLIKNMAEVGLILLEIREIGPTSTLQVGRSGAHHRLISHRSESELATIGVPNILKYGDEYSRKVGIKSGRTPDKLRSVSGFPALPALPDIKDLTATPPDEGSEALAGAPTTSTTPRKKGSCYVVGCMNTGTVKIDGKWYCRTCDPEYIK